MHHVFFMWYLPGNIHAAPKQKALQPHRPRMSIDLYLNSNLFTSLLERELLNMKSPSSVNLLESERVLLVGRWPWHIVAVDELDGRCRPSPRAKVFQYVSFFAGCLRKLLGEDVGTFSGWEVPAAFSTVCCIGAYDAKAASNF